MEAQGRWLPVRHAAQQLGISERSIRRYLRAGVYHGRLIAGNTQVWLPAAGGTSPPVLPVSDASSGNTGSTVPVLPDMSGTTGEETAGTTGNQGNEGSLAVIELARLLREALDGKSTAEQAAAMWQERARNLETQVEQLLALPAHEEEPPRRWWRFWR